jgi:hypothetical protein
MGSLTEALESPKNAPPKGAKPVIEQLQGLQSRTMGNRTRLLDRYHQLPLYGKARDKSDGPKCRWMRDGMPSDHPLVQMILSLRMDEEELVLKENDEYVTEMEPKERLRMTRFIRSCRRSSCWISARRNTLIRWLSQPIGRMRSCRMPRSWRRPKPLALRC